MQTEIRYGRRAGGNRSLGNPRRIGSDARDVVFAEKLLRFSRKPRRGARLAGNRAADTLADLAQESASERQMESKAGRQLDKHRPEFWTQSGDLVNKSIQQLIHLEQSALMRNRLRHLHGKTKIHRHAGDPASIGLRLMRTIEGGVNLGRVEAGGVALKPAALGRKTLGMPAR